MLLIILFFKILKLLLKMNDFVLIQDSESIGSCKRIVDISYC